MLNERKLTKSELDRREDIIQDMKKNKRGLVKRYGKDAEKVMYGRATNLAKKKTEAMDQDRLKEMIKDALQNPKAADLNKDGKNISITTGEFDLLKVFTDHAKQPLSRDRIMQLAKGKELDVFDRSIDVQISRIRRLIEDNPNKPKYLQTKWGYGYIFDPDGEAQ